MGIWQQTRKINKVMAVHRSFSRNGIYSMDRNCVAFVYWFQKEIRSKETCERTEKRRGLSISFGFSIWAHDPCNHNERGTKVGGCCLAFSSVGRWCLCEKSSRVTSWCVENVPGLREPKSCGSPFSSWTFLERTKSSNPCCCMDHSQKNSKLHTLRSGLATSGRTHITGRIKWRNLMVNLTQTTVLLWWMLVGWPEKSLVEYAKRGCRRKWYQFHREVSKG